MASSVERHGVYRVELDPTRGSEIAIDQIGTIDKPRLRGSAASSGPFRPKRRPRCAMSSKEMDGVLSVKP